MQVLKFQTTDLCRLAAEFCSQLDVWRHHVFRIVSSWVFLVFPASKPACEDSASVSSWIFSTYSASRLSLLKMLPVCLMNLFNIFCFRASCWRSRRCVFLSLFSISWVLSTFPASGLASEASGNVPSWGKSQDHYTTLGASPNAQRMLHGKLLCSCNRHNLAKICGRGSQCLTCYIVTITLQNVRFLHIDQFCQNPTAVCGKGLSAPRNLMLKTNGPMFNMLNYRHKLNFQVTKCGASSIHINVLQMQQNIVGNLWTLNKQARKKIACHLSSHLSKY